ncbi:MAG: pyridoxal phosphate-dependent aminotransferase [Bacteroidota bacterium]
MFSSRTQWNFQPNPLTKLLEQMRSRGERVIDLTESNPTHCGLQNDLSPFVEALSQDAAHIYSPDPKGLNVARSAVQKFYKGLGMNIESSQVVVTASTSEAYSFLFRLLCNPGEKILVPKPGYPLLEYLAQLNDVTIGFYRLIYDGEWHVDLESLKEQLGDGARILVLVHPNNPTGSWITSEELAEIRTIAKRHSLAIISDEVFGAFSFGENSRRAPSFAQEQSVLAFTLNGLSKLLALPQLKLSWVVVNGPPAERSGALQRLEVIADTYLSVNTPLQQALPKLLESAGSMTSRIVKRARGNLDILRQVFSPPSAVSVLRCDGGWNAILQFPRTKSDEEWALELLKSKGVLVHPGHLFDMQQEACLVVSLLPEDTIYRDAVSRMEALLRA